MAAEGEDKLSDMLLNPMWSAPTHVHNSNIKMTPCVCMHMCMCVHKYVCLICLTIIREEVVNLKGRWEELWGVGEKSNGNDVNTVLVFYILKKHER